jgi:hypothetical protein
LLHAGTAYGSGTVVLEARSAVDSGAGIREQYRTAGPDGTFCCTFFKATAVRGG